MNMKNIPTFEEFVNESHYAFLGGNSNFTDDEMKKKRS